MLAAAVLTTALAAAPQGGLNRELPPHLRPQLDYPSDVPGASFAPFVDAQGQPIRIAPLAVDAADFDGDGNLETWFLAGAGGAGEISVQMPQTADIGRFLPYALLAPSPLVAGATYHTTTAATDLALMVDPTSGVLHATFYVPSATRGPRGGSWITQPTPWVLGYDAYEIATADHDRDGHDDILGLLRVTANGNVTGTTIVKLRMGTSRGYLDQESAVVLSVPLVLERLVTLDLDADGTSDLVAHVPGVGVVSLADDRAGSFRLVDFVPLAGGLLRDLCAGDLDRDGRGDFGIVLDQGVVVCLSRPTGLTMRWAPSPPGVGALATARVLDAYGEVAPDVVAIPRDGRHLVIHPFDRVMADFLAPVVKTSPVATPPLGPGNPGVHGVAALVRDLDGDLDDDLLLQRPDGATWITLFGPALDVRPMEIKVESLGPMGSMGFTVERFHVTLREDLFVLGLPQVEVGVFLEEPFTREQVYWERVLLTPDPVTRSVTFLVNVMNDSRNVPWMFGPPRYTFHTNGGVTTGGPTVLSLHAKNGTRRYRSIGMQWDGRPDGNGSAVGVRWKVVAAPPLPVSDAQLLPWN